MKGNMNQCPHSSHVSTPPRKEGRKESYATFNDDQIYSKHIRVDSPNPELFLCIPSDFLSQARLSIAEEFELSLMVYL